MTTGAGHPTLQQRFVHETVEYLWVLAYVATVIVAFTAYRRLVLAEYGVAYFPYAFGLMEAMVLAKVIMVGQALHLGRGLTTGPRIRVVAWRTVLFGLLVFAFTLVESAVKRLLHHQGFLPRAEVPAPWMWDEALARSIVLVVALVPLFAIEEVRRVLGPGELYRLFFKGDGPASAPPPGRSTPRAP